jgi:hypothetical protein
MARRAHEQRSCTIPDADVVPLQVIAAAEALVDRSADVELLVVGSRGRSAVRGALLESVALHCLTHAACRAVVIHPVPTGMPAGAPVVVGVAGSAESLVALGAGGDGTPARRRGGPRGTHTGLLPGWTDEMVARVLADRSSGPGDSSPTVTLDPVEAADDVLVKQRERTRCPRSLLKKGLV